MAKKITKEDSLLSIVSIILFVIIGFGYGYFNIDEITSSEVEETNTNVVSSYLQVYYLDVGQADCTIISNNGHYMLIDGGNNADGSKIVEYIKELNIERFDYVVATHPHEDHIGGLDDIINNFAIGTIYMPNAVSTTPTFEELLTSIKNKGLSVTVPNIGDKIKLSEADLEFMYVGEQNEDLNNSSIVLKMIFGKYSYLFTGDATSEIENKLLNSNINIDVLKVAHHGSKYSSTEGFLNKVTPSYAIISVGKNNSYGHPDKETLNLLNKYTDNIYRTDELGTIMISSDGTYIDVISYETNTNGEEYYEA